ncbi:MAG: hypothetical protein ABSH20_02850, partial [Tepidisphaeraceae bacterium]
MSRREVSTMFEQIIFIGSLSGVASTFAWLLARVLWRDDGNKVRERLRVRQPAAGRKPEKATLGELVQHIGEAAASPFMPKTREKQSAIRRQLALAGIYNPAAIRAVMGFKFILLLGGLAGGYLL